jgi:hypothetical protein
MSRDGLIRIDKQTQFDLARRIQAGIDKLDIQKNQAQTGLDRRQADTVESGQKDRQTDKDGPGRTETQTYTDLEQTGRQIDRHVRTRTEREDRHRCI